MRVGIGCCNQADAHASGLKAAREAVRNGGIQRPDLVLAFCAGALQHDGFLSGLRSVLGDDVPVIGGSAIGIITNDWLSYEGFPSGMVVFQLDGIQGRVAASGFQGSNEREAGRELGRELSRQTEDRLLFLVYDSIKAAATAESPPVLNASTPLIEGLEETLGPDLPIIGAGLVGDYALNSTRQFCGSSLDTLKAVGLMLGGDFTPYFRIMHGCTPLDGVYHTITRMEGTVIYELDGKSIVEIIDGLYGNQNWRLKRPVDLLTLGRNHGPRFGTPEEANYVNRLITGVLPVGGGICIFEPDFEPGNEIQFMLRDTTKMVESARDNSVGVMKQISADGRKPLFGLYIDCAGRAAGYSNTLVEEASEVQKIFDKYHTPLFGFYSGVEIAPFLRQSRGLDWTGVLMVIAEG